jgi:hypothetical protein
MIFQTLPSEEYTPMNFASISGIKGRLFEILAVGVNPTCRLLQENCL